MTTMTAPRPFRPWYKQGWPWFLIALPTIAVVACSVTLYFAITTETSLVVDDYYQAGRAINQDLARQAQARKLGVDADVMFGENGNIRVFLRQKGTLPATLQLSLQHPTQAKYDQTLPLKRIADGLYEGHGTSVSQGRWYLSLESMDERWRVEGEALLPAIDKVTLTPGS